MRRVSVILITVAATVAVITAAGALLFGVSKAGGDEGWLLLHSKQAAECRDGGGCAVYSSRELATMLKAAAMHGYMAGQSQEPRQGL